MAIQKDKQRGTWMSVISYRDSVTGERKWKRKRGFETKREALAWEVDARKNLSTVNRSTSFANICEQWETFNQASEQTIKKHREHFSKRFPYFNEPIASISKTQLLEWRTWLASTEYSTRTKNTTIQYVKSVFKFAHTFHDVKDVSIYIQPFKMTDSEIRNEFDVWTVDEFNQFIAYVEKKVFKYYFETLFWTGMRRGEAIALQKSDLRANQIVVRFSQRYAKDGLKSTKTRQQRTITIDSVLQSHLEELLSTDGTYVFGGDSPLSVTEIQRQFDRAIKLSKVHRIRIHDLRHSHATWLINNGASIVSVSKRLGHSDVNMTLKVYTHAIKEQDDRMIQMIEDVKSEQS